MAHAWFNAGAAVDLADAATQLRPAATRLSSMLPHLPLILAGPPRRP